MRSMRTIIGFFTTFFFTSLSFGQTSSLTQDIAALISKYNHNAHIGIIITNTKNHRAIFSKNAQQRFTPASTQKLLTTTAALFYLKPNFRFMTSLRYSGEIIKHTLYGNIYIYFSGDPTLNAKNLLHLIKRLNKKDITKITGDVILVNTAYKHIPYPPGWVWDDLSYDYAAPLNTIILNRNRFRLHLTPADGIDKPVHISSNLPLGTAKFLNFTRTTKRYHKHCPISIYSNSHDEYTIRGCFVKSLGEQHRTLAIRNAARYAVLSVKHLLSLQHIKINGNVTTGHLPKNTQWIATHDSKPLKHIIIHLLKESDNLFADTLLKKMGERYSHHPGSWQNGIKALKSVLSKNTAIDFNTLHLNDGAGLSRYNLVTPLALSELLSSIYHNKPIRKIMFNALPIAGYDGTLAARMKKYAQSERVRAKTGSMTGVTSLAGFVKTKSNHRLTFVIMINGFTGKRWPYISLENKLCELLVAKA